MSHHLTDSNHDNERNQQIRFIKKGTGWIALAAAIIAAFILLLLHPEAYSMFQDLIMMKNVPQLSMNASYGMILTVGILTSFHCAGMCGGIAIAQSIRTGNGDGKLERFRRYTPSIRYNGGRVVSYTIFGGLAGGLGQVFQFSGVWRGVIPLIGGLFMIIMGINLLGLFKALRRINLSMPSFAFNLIRNGASRLGPFAVGLLSALMPCGPLQIMQLYALGTGSVVHGALSMLVFSLGTVPMLFLFGAVHPMLSKKFAGRVLKASALIVIALGLVMLNRGFALSGVSLPYGYDRLTGSAVIARLDKDGKTQVAQAQAGKNSYPQIVVQKGIPVSWNLHVDEEDLNNCNNALSLPGFKIEQKLHAGDNTIRFTPNEKGEFVYTCWMGMIKSSIIVVEDISRYDRNRSSANGREAEPEASPGSFQIASGGSGALHIPPSIPAEEAERPGNNGKAAAAAGADGLKHEDSAAVPGTDAHKTYLAKPSAESERKSTPGPSPTHGQTQQKAQASKSAGHSSSEKNAKSAADAAAVAVPSVGNRKLDVKASAPSPASSMPAAAPAASTAPSSAPKAGSTSGTGTAVNSGEQEIQTVVTIVTSNSYSPIKVKKGTPVKWIIRVTKNQLNDCNNEIIVPAFHLSKKLVPGDNIVEFTPGETGKFPFTCWMEMIESSITVTDGQ
ncbi:Sulfite exporter TauE/SafE [Paenibacillus sophorae]|uniref:Sulfite exporter TauE/SafE n=1 Tax=Paenibacillus sophorae TaxID=1333845 RepID=A0A1H8FNY7_9BACL|nr:sulfite exporter TauE/SafE family protein [Paenibacillus sophorae]QWU13931.1 sulfite exporter TauE/SafE family protein [Paenibacillus sophorae]SEN33310.1 Sulfite exporter TauE/SafE [Paenibacillus sophorae]